MIAKARHGRRQTRLAAQQSDPDIGEQIPPGQVGGEIMQGAIALRRVGAMTDNDQHISHHVPRGPNRITAAPPRQITALARSHRSGRWASTNHIQPNDAAI